jgi:steroid delta-isomerase
MASAEDVQELYEQYAAAWSRHDLDAVTALFAADAVVHDPVDGPALKGAEAIREFFQEALGVVRAMRLVGPVHLSADCRHAAARVDVHAEFGDGIRVVEALDVWTLDGDGRILAMEAYYGPTNLRDP